MHKSVAAALRGLLVYASVMYITKQHISLRLRRMLVLLYCTCKLPTQPKDIISENTHIEPGFSKHSGMKDVRDEVCVQSTVSSE